MNDDNFDEYYKKFKERFRDFFEGFSGIFNKDFDFTDFSEFPKVDFDKDFKFKDNDTKSYSISYHFQTGMDKPEIRVRGNINDKFLAEFLRGIPGFITEQPTIKKLSLTPESLEKISKTESSGKPSEAIEPYADITDLEDYIEICLELPGVKKEEIKLEFNENGEILTLNAKRDGRRFYKEIKLPADMDIKNYTLELNNGIASIKIKHKKTK
jgi:HSP20 family molecular chaperone IbpA